MPTWRSLAVSLIERAGIRWVVLTLVSAAIVATAVQSYRDIDDELTKVALLRREAVARLTATMLAEKFGRAVDTGISLATRVRFRELVADGRWAEAIQIMRSVPRDLPHIERLFLADTTGTLRADVPALAGVRGMNFSSRDWFKGVKQEWRPYVSPIYKRAASPQLNVFAVVVPVRNNAGGVTAILVLQLRIEKLLEWVGSITIGPEEYLHIVDSKDQLAFHSKRRDQSEIVDMSGNAIVKKLRQARHGVEIGVDPVEGETITAYATVPEYGWGIITQQPTRASTALAAKNDQLRRLVTGYGLILLLAASAIVMASKLAAARKRAEGEARYRQTLDTMLEGCQILDHGWHYLYINDAAQRHNRRPKQELLGRTMTEVWPGIEQTEVFAAAARCMGERTPHQLTTEFTFADSSTGWYEVAIHPVLEGIFILSADISERKLAEDEIRRLNTDLERKVVERTAELEAVNREVEAFSYSVSHDLRAPLRSIDGFSQALLEDYAGKLDATGREHLQRVRAGAQRMAALIDDLLSLSRVTRVVMQRVPVDLSDMAATVAGELRQGQPGRVAEIAIQPGMVAEGDPALLHVLLTNLFANAWKFTGRTERARIEFGVLCENGAPVYFVRDNGAGFDMQYAHKLFGAFQRLHGMEEFPGTGIGLATVQRVVNRHGGSVWAEGRPGEGATFYFSLWSSGPNGGHGP